MTRLRLRGMLCLLFLAVFVLSAGCKQEGETGPEGEGAAGSGQFKKSLDGILESFKSTDGKSRRAALQAMQWLPQGLLEDFDVKSLHPFLQPKTFKGDSILALAFIAERGLLKSKETLDLILELAERGGKQTNDMLETADDRLDRQISRALASNCELSGGAAWKKLQGGAAGPKLYLDVVRTCGSGPEQSKWFAKELKSKIKVANRAISSYRTGWGDKDEATAKLRIASMYIRAAAGAQPADVIPLLKKYSSNRYIGTNATTALLAVAARNRDQVLKALGKDKSLHGLLLRSILGDESAKPRLEKRLKRAKTGDLALVARLIGGADVVDRLCKALCKEKNPAVAGGLASAILSAYATWPELMKGAKTYCGMKKMKKPGSPGDDFIRSAVDEQKKAIKEALAKASRLPVKQFEKLPAFAVALAQRGELHEAVATLVYIHATASAYMDAYMELMMKARGARLNRISNIISSLGDLSTEDGIESLWNLLTKRKYGDLLNKVAGVESTSAVPTREELDEMLKDVAVKPKDPEFISAVVGALQKESENILVTFKIGDVIGYMKDPRAVDLIVKRTEKRGFHTKGVYGLARLYEPGDPKLEGLLKHKSGDVRRLAAFAMGLQRSKKALPALQKLLESKDPGDRTAAQMATVWILKSK